MRRSKKQRQNKEMPGLRMPYARLGPLHPSWSTAAANADKERLGAAEPTNGLPRHVRRTRLTVPALSSSVKESDEADPL
jgi:hypothetical protein